MAARFHRRMVLSRLLLASVPPSGLNATDVIPAVGPVSRMLDGTGSVRFQTRIVLLEYPTARNRPRGLNARQVTRGAGPDAVPLESGAPCRSPFAVFHSWTTGMASLPAKTAASVE